MNTASGFCLAAAAGAFALGLSGCTSSSGNKPAKLVKVQSVELRAKSEWSRDVGVAADGDYLGLVPVVRGGVIYTADVKGRVVATDIETGDIRWSVKTGRPLLGGPGYAGDQLLFGTRNGNVLALSTEDGSQLWTRMLTSEVTTAPVRVGDTIVARAGDGRLFGLSLDGQEQTWTFERATPALTLRGVSAPLDLDGRTVLIGLDNGRLLALNAATGEPAWEQTVSEPDGRTELERIADVDAELLLQDDQIFAVGYNGDIAAFRAFSGTESWRRPLSSYSGTTVEAGRVFVSDAAGSLYAFDASSGAKVWESDELSYRGLSAPVAFKGNIVVGDKDGYLHWFSPADGKIVARRRVGSAPLRVAPKVYDGKLLVYSASGELTLIDVAPVSG